MKTEALNHIQPPTGRHDLRHVGKSNLGLSCGEPRLSNVCQKYTVVHNLPHTLFGSVKMNLSKACKLQELVHSQSNGMSTGTYDKTEVDTSHFTIQGYKDRPVTSRNSCSISMEIDRM